MFRFAFKNQSTKIDRSPHISKKYHNGHIKSPTALAGLNINQHVI